MAAILKYSNEQRENNRKQTVKASAHQEAAATTAAQIGAKQIRQGKGWFKTGKEKERAMLMRQFLLFSKETRAVKKGKERSRCTITTVHDVEQPKIWWGKAEKFYNCWKNAKKRGETV